VTDDKLKALERERERQRTINAYHRVFLGPEGEIVLADLRKSFGTDFQAFLPGNYDPIAAALRDGQRGAVLHIEGMLRRTPAADGNFEEPKRKIRK
jgi:hypothetical protein